MTKEAENPHHTESALPAGSIPALVTPMHEDGSLNWQSYRALIDWHIEAGTDRRGRDRIHGGASGTH
jgi:4-hydroxy-tetrahydrodipicolinate synthase